MDPTPQPYMPGQTPEWPQPGVQKAGRFWLSAAIIGSAIVIAAGLIAGAMILKKGDSGPTTCDAWGDTQSILRSIPALPNGWTYGTPGIDTMIGYQNSPVAGVLEVFEHKIRATPADVAQAAKDYVATRRKQSVALGDHSYTAETGAATDTALQRLNQLCGVSVDGRPN